jgi:hypothetical protein
VIALYKSYSFELLSANIALGENSQTPPNGFNQRFHQPHLNRTPLLTQGHGAFGQVYRATCVKNKRIFALKRMQK